MRDKEDLFGVEVKKDPLLRDKFIEPPFSILDTKQGSWQKRKRKWLSIGMRSELGRSAKTFNIKSWCDEKTDQTSPSDTSIFDPALCEVIYHWFCKEGGTIIDPFAGGSVRGIVANYLGYKYTGIDIREEQILSNREQGLEIIPDRQPEWLIGDSNLVLPTINKRFDFVFSCPPYADLEVYSQLVGDISNMPYRIFIKFYQEIITKSCSLLKPGKYACFVVGEVRDKDGNYYGFVPDTIRCFENAGMKYYNEGILLNAISTAALRADSNMKYQKLVKVHQNILVFKKPESTKFSLL